MTRTVMSVLVVGLVPQFQTSMTPASWEYGIQQMRDRYGTIVQRELASREAGVNPPDRGVGTFTTFMFMVRTDTGQRVVETVTSHLGGDGTWRVAGYIHP